ncbi:helix-turn-helix domain protein [Desulfofundulus kuznetsovii DSM 6115]|uniref:Helix-turn-helix domain protein n=1 Tax=Desulfofundulus kuznetsovii (strain DSM 6115 / VKM B-1805 / 17) TaxID=760568 RepID=A0AAU8Q257_DESK7|nr:helix-turn-helix domain protein [Desulfofundulus kuznetsovii DSM 6115]
MLRLSGFKLARMKAGLTQLELARRLGCSESLIAKWETGRGKPTPERLEQLCKVLNCKPEDLLREAV